jgi:ligand-binding sensor domain-containing protein
MRFHLFLGTLFCFLSFFTSCNAQNDSVPVAIKTSPIPDSDPYFVMPKAVARNYRPTSITRNILQDKNGMMWFSSWEGIVRYDPKAKTDAFVNYTLKENLVKFHTFSLLEDSKGNIWFGTIGGGLYKYVSENQTFTHITTNDGLIGNSVGCIYEDKAGRVWFGTSQGISCLISEDEKGDYLFQNYTTKDGLTNDDINSIVEDQSGRVWFGTRGATCYLQDGKFINFSVEHNMPFQNVRSIIEDQNGNIWLGGNNGLWRYTPSSGHSEQSTFANITPFFTGYIYEDRKGTIWFGANKSGQREWNLYRLNEPISSLKPEWILQEKGQIFGLVEDQQRNIWFGHERGICRLGFDVGPMGGAIGEYFLDEEK